jgi:hypothetical protein
MTGSDIRDGPDRNVPASIDWVVPAAGILLVLFAVVLPSLFSFRQDIVIIALVLLGVGCTTLWFGLVHKGMLRTGTRIEEVIRKQEKVQNLIDRIKK